MSNFSELLDNPQRRSPVDVQADAEREFSCRVTQSGLSLRLPNSPKPSGSTIILGVASYSPAELQLLDEIESRKSDWSSDGTKVEVFDVLNCRAVDDFNSYLPGNSWEIRRSPVIGVWRGGQLECVETGLHSVRETLQDREVLS